MIHARANSIFRPTHEPEAIQMKNTLLLLALTLPGPLLAQETRELGAHEHGHSALNIALEGSRVAMTFEAPGADIVGFEHAAKTAEDRAKLDAGIADLSKPLSLFVLPAAAGCTVIEARAELVADDHSDAHDHAEGHDHADAHDHAEGHDHASKEHAHDDHDHEEHADAAGAHTEFQAEYMLDCEDVTAIDRIEFMLFETFPNAREVEVQIVSDKGGQVFEVLREQPVLDLAGRI